MHNCRCHKQEAIQRPRSGSYSDVTAFLSQNGKKTCLRQGPEIFTPEFFRFTGRTQAIRTGSRNFGFQQAVLPAPIADKTAFYRIFAYDSQRKPYSLI